MMDRVPGARAVFALVVAAGIAAAGASPGAADEASAAELTTERVEEIVRDYLLREPEIVYEALEELQRRQQAAAQERQRAAIVENRDELYHDPADPVAGNPAGEVTLVEFFDYRCSYCRRVVSSMQALLEDDPDLRIVFKELPVLGQESVRAAQAAIASQRQDGYVPFHFALMEASDLSEQGIFEVARSVGLDAEQLREDMESPEVQAVIESNYELANRLGIEGTPAFVIDDTLVPGAVSKAQLEELIASARAG